MSSFSDDYRADRQRRSLKQVEGGGLPLDAEWRLSRLRDNHKLFTGNLSINELALMSQTGIRPLGQVMGASTYKIGWQFTQPLATMELAVISQAHIQARLLAMGRLEKEAQLIGADGVVGVRVNRRHSEEQRGVIEYHVFGTAVRLGGEQRWEKPFICAVGVQELWKLMHTGHFPVGCVYGTSVHYHVASFRNRWKTGMIAGSPIFTANAELTDYSGAIYKARETAMGMLEFEARAVQADGVVGIEIEQKNEFREVEYEVNEVKIRRRDIIVHFTVSGTAIRPCRMIPSGGLSYSVSLEG